MTDISAGIGSPRAAREDDCGCGDARRSASRAVAAPHAPAPSGDPLAAFERNAFYPRKRMEVRHWQAEQDYHRGTRELLTRLGTGCGVLCGLDVYATETGTVVLTAGAGVDGRGREIVVPVDIEVDPSQPTDGCGRPQGEPVAEGPVTLSLCYRECGTDVVALEPDPCDGDPRCVPSMIREAFAVRVTVGECDPQDDRLCSALFGGQDDGERGHTAAAEGEESSDRPQPGAADEGVRARRARLDRVAPRDCAGGCGCDGDCIPLATVELRGDAPVRVDQRARTVIRSNREMLALILCLAERLEECCGRPPVPTAAAPKIVGMFPWPSADPADVVAALRDDPVVEIAFDRPMDATDLATPDGWLGLWMLGGREAFRARLVPTALVGRVSAPAGGVVAAYRIEVEGPRGSRALSRAMRTDRGAQSAALVVMVRSDATGVIRAGAADRLALDADLAGTKLDDARRAALWAIHVGDQAPFDGIAQAVPADVMPAVPSGDDDPQGELHIVLTLEREPVEEVDAPHLVAVWPAAGTRRRPATADDDFLEKPRLRLTISSALDPAAVASPRDWLRAWHCEFGDGRLGPAFEEFHLDPGAADAGADGAVDYTFMMPDARFAGTSAVLVLLRPDVAGVPVGEDPGAPLLDADWASTVFRDDELDRLWAGDAFPSGSVAPFPPSIPSPLHDGTAGGSAHWVFVVTTR
ncbi:hypothetical protein [Agromyces bracchium]|uniref:Uncharacterized protein n=1 Tax=Agromyces bracchium TaxID=88376 RepID=A0A6I3MC11_9MICO|nr:hypothetical protein [Agromyces bracchium]MTH70298.1 hypothetical protein [Agromyces bracchium]